MRLLVTADLQLGAGAGYGTEATPRLRDNAASLDSISTLIEEHDVVFLIIAGDVFQHRRPAVDELLLFSTWLDALPCEAIIIAGNHDVRGPGMPTTIDLFAYRPDVHVFTAPDVMQLSAGSGPGVMLGVLPWAHPGNMRAFLREDLERAGTVEREELLLRVAEGLALEAGVLTPSSDSIPVLVTHFALSGMSTPTGLPTSDLDEPVLDCHELDRQGWSYVFAGHVHQRDVVELAEDFSAWSIGAPWRHDFGEASIDPGVLLLDTETPRVNVLPIPDRNFVTLELEAHEHPDEGRIAPLGPPADVDGAIVRVVVRCTEEQAGRVDLDAIRRNLAMRGAHNVHSIRLDVERTRRARADITEDSEPLAALDAWARANELEATAAERLRELTASLLEGER